MSDNNVRWEPIRGNERLAAVGRIADMLPTGYALCRAVPVTWSQEPPDAPGWWWRWSPSRGVELYLIEPELGDGPLWNATDPADDMMYPVSRTVSVPGIYWLPATVPQPPGEVGP